MANTTEVISTVSLFSLVYTLGGHLRRFFFFNSSIKLLPMLTPEYTENIILGMFFKLRLLKLPVLVLPAIFVGGRLERSPEHITIHICQRHSAISVKAF